MINVTIDLFVGMSKDWQHYYRARSLPHSTQGFRKPAFQLGFPLRRCRSKYDRFKGHKHHIRNEADWMYWGDFAPWVSSIPWHCSSNSSSDVTVVSDPSVPWRIIFRRLMCRVSFPNHTRFRPLRISSEGSREPTRDVILLCKYSLDLCTMQQARSGFHEHLGSNALMCSQHQQVCVFLLRQNSDAVVMPL